MKLFCLLTIAVMSCMALPLPKAVTNDNADERGENIESDIKLPPGTKAGIVNPQRRWANGNLVYEFDPTFSSRERDVIRSGMSEISSKTCITFTERANQLDYVYIHRETSGCWSYVGRLGGRQELNLQSPSCVTMGIAAHELIHAIGFYHEHSRTDRDDYIAVNWDNIKSGRASAFNKYTASQVEPYDVPYDYGSIMHYSGYAFAEDSSSPTIIPKESEVTIGQRTELSAKDALKINRMYGCDNLQ